VVLRHRPHPAALGQVARDRPPRAPAVVAAQQVRLEVAGLVTVHRDEDRVPLQPGGLHLVDEEVVGHARQLVGLLPRLPAILRHLHVPIVRARVDQPLDQRRLAEGGDGREHRHRAVVPQRVGAPGPAHDRLLEAEDVAGEVGADLRPRVAPVVAAPHVLRPVVEARVRVRRDDDGRVPVEAQRGLVGAGPRADVDGLLALAVVAQQVPFLPLEVDDVGVGGVHGHRVAVGAVRDDPVGVADAVVVQRARGPGLGAVVLRPAVDEVEGLRIVQGDLVELRDGEVLEEAPGLAAVPGFVDAPVAAVEDVAGVAGDECHRVVVAVLVLLADRPPRAPAVIGHAHVGIHLVDPVEGVRIREDLLIVVRPGAAADVAVALLPALAAVGRAVEPALVGRGLDGGVHDRGVHGRDGQADLPLVAGGQADGELAPGLAGVGGLVDAGVGAAAHERGDGAPALVGGRVDHVGVRRVELGARHAGVLVDLERDLPRRAAILRLVEASLATRRPERPFGRRVDHVGVPRVHEDPGDVLRLPEAGVRPGLAAVQALVDTVAGADVTAADVLPGPHPDRLVIARVDRQAADRVGRLLVEDGRPGRAAVLRLPHAARPDGDVPDVAVLWMDGDVADPPRHDRRPDVAEGQAGERGLVDQRLGSARLALRPGTLRRARWGGRGLRLRLLGGNGQGQGEQCGSKGKGASFHGLLLQEIPEGRGYHGLSLQAAS